MRKIGYIVVALFILAFVVAQQMLLSQEPTVAQKTDQKLPGGPKQDLRGFVPGMPVAAIEARIKTDRLKCGSEDRTSGARTCKAADGEIVLTYSTALNPKVLKQVDLYFQSGLDPTAMTQMISQQYDARPIPRAESQAPILPAKDVRKSKQAPKAKELPKAAAPTEAKQEENPLFSMFSSMGLRLSVAKWVISDTTMLELSGAEYYKITLSSPSLDDADRHTFLERVEQERRSRNPAPKF